MGDYIGGDRKVVLAKVIKVLGNARFSGVWMEIKNKEKKNSITGAKEIETYTVPVIGQFGLKGEFSSKRGKKFTHVSVQTRVIVSLHSCGEGIHECVGVLGKDDLRTVVTSAGKPGAKIFAPDPRIISDEIDPLILSKDIFVSSLEDIVEFVGEIDLEDL